MACAVPALTSVLNQVLSNAVGRARLSTLEQVAAEQEEQAATTTSFGVAL
jgi:hypothetical protein